LIIMGVSGCGKTTVGRALAARLSFEFVEGDDLHPSANVAKMTRGIALTDSDRQPWLLELRRLMDSIIARQGDAVVTCSALKQSYRELLADPAVRFVYLKIEFEAARERLAHRRGHFFNPELLQSQFAVLEEPGDALIVDADQETAAIVDEIAKLLGRR
jgi:gluconokinase